MTNCVYGLLICLSLVLMLPVPLVIMFHVKPFLRRLGERRGDRRLRLFQISNLAYPIAVAAGITVLMVLPKQSELKPCGPRGSAMVKAAVQVAEYLPLSFADEALAKTVERCASEK